MDSFLAYTECEATTKITFMIYIRELKDTTFEEVSQIMKKNLRPKKKIGHCGEDEILVKNTGIE